MGVYRFINSPALFVYSPIVGYFPGAFYDRGAAISSAYLVYRLGSFAWLIALGSAVVALFPEGLHAIVIPTGWRLGVTGLAFLSTALGIEIYAHGESLGHRTGEEYLRSELGGYKKEGPCRVSYPSELEPLSAGRLARDCAFRVRQIEKRLGLGPGDPVYAYFYRNAAEKKRLIGARSTFVAKPWRREVHLQLEAWPHPVLGHEVAHVVSGDVALRPFRVSARLGGLLPDPALIEGMAVALAWDVRDGMTPHQWAHVLLQLKKLPSIEALTGFSFLSGPSLQGYTTMGSFLRFIRDSLWQTCPSKSLHERRYREGDRSSTQ